MEEAEVQAVLMLDAQAALCQECYGSLQALGMPCDCVLVAA